METLRAYLATLTPKQQAAYAIRCGTTIGYLRKGLSIGAKFKGELVRKLDEESGGAVARTNLRPGYLAGRRSEVQTQQGGLKP
jgi:hypothetical protein